jgi:hypothetical protein
MSHSALICHGTHAPVQAAGTAWLAGHVTTAFGPCCCVLQATLVDGGTLSNFPISLFDRPVSLAVGLNTLCPGLQVAGAHALHATCLLTDELIAVQVTGQCSHHRPMAGNPVQPYIWNCCLWHLVCLYSLHACPDHCSEALQEKPRCLAAKNPRDSPGLSWALTHICCVTH